MCTTTPNTSLITIASVSWWKQDLKPNLYCHFEPKLMSKINSRQKSIKTLNKININWLLKINRIDAGMLTQVHVKNASWNEFCKTTKYFKNLPRTQLEIFQILQNLIILIKSKELMVPEREWNVWGVEPI